MKSPLQLFKNVVLCFFCMVMVVASYANTDVDPNCPEAAFALNTELHSIGNQVWSDVNNNGLIDVDEPGIAGVSLILHKYDTLTSTFSAVDTVLTDADGFYLFDTLDCGRYIVQIDTANFLAGAVLHGRFSSTGSGEGPILPGTYEDPANPVTSDSNINLDDNGVLQTAGDLIGLVTSDTITLGEDEPIGEGDDPLDTNNDASGALDNYSNLTIDFGFIPRKFDLALRKTILDETVKAAGDTVQFQLEIFNQGNVGAYDIALIDYIPDGLELDAASATNANWTLSGTDATYTYTDTILAGQSATVLITLKLKATAEPSNVVNMAEISGATDDIGNTTAAGLIDEDSTPDTDNTNDSGNGIYSPQADIINENGKAGGDEDDHDQAWVNLCDALACRSDLNLSLDGNCESILTPSMLLTENNYPDTVYTITVVDENGLERAPDSFTGADIGKSFMATLNNRVCNNSCMVNIHVEDKFPPQIVCTSDTITCGQLPTFPPVVAVDNCSGATTTLINETEEKVACSDTVIFKIISRTYVSIDAAGNVGDTCVQELSLRKFDIGEVEAPADLTINIECGDSYAQLPNGNPDPVFYGSPRLGGQNLWPNQYLVCNLMVNYSDKKFQTAKNTESIVRTWTATNWYCGADTTATFVQVFNFSDTQGPQITCSPDLTFNTSGVNCTADIVLPTLAITDKCVDVDRVTMQYKGGFKETNGGAVSIESGVSDVVYTAYDTNGNSNSCTFKVTVTDNEQPIAVCDLNTEVTLPTGGIATVDAATFDNGSFDACGPVTLEVRRMESPCNTADLNFGPSVQFCCQDIGTEKMVVLRVTDQSGLTNECMVSVTVGDKVPPILVRGLPDITVSCDYPFDVNNTEAFGSIQTDAALVDSIRLTSDTVNFNAAPIDGLVIGNCVELVEDNYNLEYMNSCGGGYALRIIRFRNAQNKTVTDIQRITFVNPSPFKFEDIVFPKDIAFNNICDLNLVEPENLPAGYDRPTFDEDACDKVGLSREDKIVDFSNGSNSCVEITRTWTVSDWCQKDKGQFKTWEGVQTITITNTTVPTITGDCSNRLVNSLDANCGPVYIELTNSATDDCTKTEHLKWTYDIDLDKNGTIDHSGNTAVASGTYPVGIHSITWSVHDGCSDVVTCTYDFELKNVKLPSPKCLDNLTAGLVAVDTDGDGVNDDERVVLTPAYFDAGSNHACDTPVKLSFSADTTDQERVYNCANIGEQPIELWVTDVNGNQDYCATTILIQDNNTDNICPPVPLVNVQGQLKTVNDDMINTGDVMLEGADLMHTTGNDGTYAFENMQTGGDYTVMPKKDNDALNGVSTLDIILIQKHILGIEPFDSPYKILAADVNKDESVNGSDLIQMRKLLLGYYENFPNNTSWRFVDADFDFPNPLNPWFTEIPESYKIHALNQNMVVDFHGVKVGDLNQSAQPNNLIGDVSEVRSGEALVLNIDNQKMEFGKPVKIAVRSSNVTTYNGMQLGLSYDSDNMVISAIESPVYNLNAENYRIDNKAGLVKMILDQKVEDLSADQVLFYISIHAKRPLELKDALAIDAEFTEAYDAAYDVQNVALDIRTKTQIKHEALGIMYQNEPNPWSTNTMIPVNLPESGLITLNIRDVQGRVVYTNSYTLSKGIHRIPVARTAVGSTGVYYYEIKTGAQSLMKKMVIID